MTYTFTEEQFIDFVEITENISDYKQTNDTPPVYENFLEKTFGEDYLDYQLDGDGNLYEYEWDYDFYYGLVTGNFSEEILEWIENQKDNMKEWEENFEEEEYDWE
jgi:hypothetical protein